MKEPIYYSSEGESEEFMNILPKKLTLNQVYPQFYKDKWSRPDFTIFREVNIKPYGAHTPELQEFLDKGRWDTTETYESVFEYLKQAIYKVWEPDKYHIVGHSSGYDSRLINKAIRELTDKYGNEWRGKVVYVETMGELPFKDIMEFLELDYVAYNHRSEPQRYHEYALKFDTFHEKYNGVFAFPFNQWYDAFRDIHEQGIIPSKNIQGFTGYGAGEVMRKAVRMKKGFDWYFRYLYRFQLWMFRHWGGTRWCHPFLDFDVMRSIEAMPQTYRCQRVAIQMAKELVSEINHIPDWQTKNLKSAGYRQIAPDILDRCYREYKKSWFGKQYEVAPNNAMDYTEWWFCYNTASLCEHLIQKGHVITNS